MQFLGAQQLDLEGVPLLIDEQMPPQASAVARIARTRALPDRHGAALVACRGGSALAGVELVLLTASSRF